QAGPPVVSRVEPEKRRFLERLKQRWDFALAVAFQDVNVLPGGKLLLRARGELRNAFHRIDLRKAVLHGGYHLTVVRPGFDQDAQLVAISVLAHGALFHQMRRAHRFAAKLPVPEVRIVSQRLVGAVERRALQKFSKGLHGNGPTVARSRLPTSPRLPKGPRF